MIFLPNCRVTTATDTGATIFVSVAVSGLRKTEPQLQQRYEQNNKICPCCSYSHAGTLLKPLPATEAHFAPSVPVAACTKN